MHHHFSPRVILSVALLGFMPQVASAQQDNPDNTAYGTNAAEFLLLGTNARGTALGGSYVAMATEVGGVNANPAAIALMTRPAAQFSQLNYVADSKMSWGAVAFPTSGGAKAFGLQLGSFGFTDQPVYTVGQPDGTGEAYDVAETFAAITYAQNFSDRFSVGISAKGVFDQLGQASGSAFAIDFGTHFHSNLSGKPIRFAFTLKNLGTKLTYDGDAIRTTSPRKVLPGEQPITEEPQASVYRTTPFSLPTIFRVGLAYDVMAGANSRMTLMGEFNQASGDKAGYGFGAELAADRLGNSNFGIAARGSYSATPSASYKTDFSGVSIEKTSDEKKQGLAVGGGISYQTPTFAIGFDYAWKSVGLLGNANYFTVTMGW